MKFSVLMSVYFKENKFFFISSLESLINQTLRPDEIILVKDGPLTNELDEMMNNYCFKYDFIKIVSLPKNSGLAHALNEGLKHCSFDIVARMDSDDISPTNRFEKQIAYLSENPEIDVLGSNICEFEGDVNNIKTIRRVPQFDKEIKRKGRLKSPVNHATIIFKKNKMLEIGGYNENISPEDYYLWLKMFKNGFIFHNIQEPLLLVRIDNGMIERRRGLSYLRKELFFFKTAYDENLIPLSFYLINIGIRSFFRILPSSVLKKAYQLIFREKP
jgi:glycosyltransferase involved in cell wall biosynthesis